MDLATSLIGVLVVVGVLGCIIPVLPGALLTVAAVLAYALMEQSVSGWVAFAIALAAYLASLVVRYVIGEKRMRTAGVARMSMVWGILLGVVGFFVVPVVGLFIGFPLGVYLAESIRLKDQKKAWASTVQAMKATGLSMLIEAAGAVVGALAWFVVVLT